EVSLEATERKYIPSLDWPSGTADEYSISKDGTVYSDKPIQKITRYSGVSILEPYSNAQLDLLTRQRALAFPKAFNKRTQSLAKQWRSQSGNDRAYIARVMQWIRKDFSYTLATKEPGINATDDFLFTDKKGFCQHFSSSFALLMRAAGIPSRVVTGYVGGYKNPYGDYWILYNKDAHAWNEVWLEGEGWVRFDPTAAVAPENILDTIQSNAGQEQYFGDQSVFSPMFDYSDFIKSNWNNWVLGFNTARQEQLFQGIGLAKIQRWQMLILLLCVAGGISYVLFLWIQTRAREKLSAVERAWQKLLLKMHKRGMGKLTYETALDYAQRIGAKDLILIAERYTQWRYGKTVFSETDIRALIVGISRLKITSNSSSKPTGQWRAGQ
ncbi:MAG: DUF3488 domain-containing protein, partial [Arenimonas sp.]|nr:DUF3488 domain-containing protein [Arenimonas sp.]